MKLPLVSSPFSQYLMTPLEDLIISIRIHCVLGGSTGISSIIVALVRRRRGRSGGGGQRRRGGRENGESGQARGHHEISPIARRAARAAVNAARATPPHLLARSTSC